MRHGSRCRSAGLESPPGPAAASKWRLPHVRAAGRRHARLVAVAVGTMAATLPAAIASGPAMASPRQGAVQPAAVMAYGGDFPDPHVLVVGDVYYAYSTNVAGVNVPVMSSTDLVSWKATSQALPPLPGWASPGRTWAPAVLARGGFYVLYYTVAQTSTGRQCISVATAASPAGPFRDTSSAPLVCQLDRGRSIGPYVFTDPGGSSCGPVPSPPAASGSRRGAGHDPLGKHLLRSSTASPPWAEFPLRRAASARRPGSTIRA
jgi:hypothetical protein